MDQSLDALISGSPGSLLISYSFESKELRFQIFHEGEGRLLIFEVPTDSVHGRSITPDPKRSTCRIELVELGEKLAVRDGRYHPPTSTAQFLDHARGRLTLAYGRRATEYPWLLRLQGQYPLLACLVHDPGDIRWTVE
jgi:hypothetical protein